jgi:hypothetical protein
MLGDLDAGALERFVDALHQSRRRRRSGRLEVEMRGGGEDFVVHASRLVDSPEVDECGG